MGVWTTTRRGSQLLPAPVQRLFLSSLSPHSLFPPILITLISTAPHWPTPPPPPLLWAFPLPISPSPNPLSLPRIPTVLYRHTPHPVSGTARDGWKQSGCLYFNMYVNTCVCVWVGVRARSCVCACPSVCECLCMTAPKSVCGSLLVCRVDSPWTHTFRLYLTPNDPPERVMREQQGKKGKTGSEGGIWG